MVPKEIYLNDFGRDEECEWFVKPLPFAHSVTKYIRADIAELTWEDTEEAALKRYQENQK